MTTRNEATDESLRLSPGEFLFETRRREMLDLLGRGSDEASLLNSFSGIGPLFTRIMALPDEDVMRLVAIVMGETLSAGSGAVELLGLSLGIDMADWWEADEAFLEPIRDRQILLELVEEVAGKLVADANRQEKTKVLKQIIRDNLAGTDGRVRTERWVPRWMRFPPAAYTDRGGVAPVIAHAHAVMQAAAGESDVEEQAADMDGQMTSGAEDEPDGEESEVCEPEEAQRLAA